MIRKKITWVYLGAAANGGVASIAVFDYLETDIPILLVGETEQLLGKFANEGETPG